MRFLKPSLNTKAQKTVNMPAKCPIKAQAKSEGKKFYFTGKPCVRGHICERRVHRSVCVLCEKARKEKMWAKYENPKQILSDWKKQYYSANPEKYQELLSKQSIKYHSDEEYRNKQNQLKKKNWQLKRLNPEFVKAENKRIAEWAKNNRPKRAAMAERRRFTLLNATPKWLTAIQKAQIEEFYEVAEALNMQTGIKHHVDHIVPLKGKNVTGFHVPWNLQILTAKDNISKGNKHEI